jgi:AAA+ superfamily predicted ATPase
LEILARAFRLSPFEREFLLLAAAPELDSSFAKLYAEVQGDPLKTYPTLSLALASLPDPHWSALSPEAPLRRFRLVEVAAGTALALSPLRIDERVLHYLAGVQYLDERLAGLAKPVGAPSELIPSHRTLMERIAAVLEKAAISGSFPVVQLCGEDGAGQRAVAAAACARLGLRLHVMPALTIPLDSREQDALMRLWEREAVLSGCALAVDCGELDTSDAVREAAITRLIEGIGGTLFLMGRDRRSHPHRLMITLEVSRPTTEEQRSLWTDSLGHLAANLDGGVEALVSQFSLEGAAIQAACARVVGHGATAGRRSGEDVAALGAALWEACRVEARPRLDNLAHRIAPVATWDDLVLPEAQKQTLREIALHVRHRHQVYRTWGFAGKSTRGLGISAVFAGASGTGKTMAAEVLANELRLDLYRIDLSQVVSKYIGETEKNLRRVFDTAEEGGAILLFDEADALFGKRSEVKDSHDRYANIEVSYLLQRMESYRGLAILTTNMKQALDPAFFRRIRFVVQFPFPDAAQRAEIWRRVFPAATPTHALHVDRLARLNVAGGNIRNIALHAAFLAADARESVNMSHLLRAARSEYAKLEKPLTEAEIGGWV